MTSATHSATPSEVLARRRELMLNMDTDGFADLFAPDAVIEFPFHGPPGAPPVRLDGREAIREYSRQFTALGLRVEEYEAAETYQAQDPEVVIVEMRTKATVTTTGRPVTATSVQVLRIREGQIVLFRDFADPRIFQELTGDGPQPLSPGRGRGN
jgi:ketosteroid isomerase-like protein